ncbi:hypothetical protein JKP88DRAFT_352146 [Tribonema minus]|uniref:Uncharacterized protein n=1 Tax=Tribonema minus TaxID=303371 RepID=A0A835ZEX8_9STRA|nr:hypothetical protein JKP88DRAFT_352146 [Tribonema minus]
MKAAGVISIALAAAAPVSGFVAPSSRSWCQQHTAVALRPVLSMKWDGKSEPKKNPLLEQLAADASWDRQNDRVEVWEDKPNPTFDWISAYLPTDEEREAAAAGYDFANPEAWLEKQKAKDSQAQT